MESLVDKSIVNEMDMEFVKGFVCGELCPAMFDVSYG